MNNHNPAFANSLPYGCFPGNPLLRTQPVKKLTSPLPEHTHTKSYDVNGIKPIQYATIPYMYEKFPKYI